MIYDFLILGGGAAGCVLANRLSASGKHSVALFEAGPDLREDAIPAAIDDIYPGIAYSDPRFIWRDQTASFTAAPGSGLPMRRPYEQAKVLGGGTSINGQQANRGAPEDYKLWRNRGATGWDWDDVLPYFRRIETDLDFNGPLHGQDGPIAIRRLGETEWCGHTRAFAQALAESGLERLDDQNGRFDDGFFSPAISNRDGHRVTTATAYLSAVVRTRKNLSVLTDSHAVELVFEGALCVGARIRREGRVETVAGREVILCCGAIQTPTILMRSGIGPGRHLAEMGISVRHDHPGVGQRLMEHPSLGVASFIHPGARMTAVTRRHIQIGARYSSGVIGTGTGDMYMLLANRAAWHQVGWQFGSILTFVNQTMSEKGEIRLASPYPSHPPDVDFKLLADARDAERLMTAFRRMVALQGSAPMAAVTSDAFPAIFSKRIRNISKVSLRNRLVTSVVRPVLDGPEALRKVLIKTFVAEGPSISRLMSDPASLEEHVHRHAAGVWHPCGSCRMGGEEDPLAVTDPEGRVRGVPGLRIADASLFPAIPRANIMLPTLMVAEKIADRILATT